jgi:hypothetical protein
MSSAMQSAGKQMAHTPQKKVQAKRWLTHHKKKCKQKDGSYNTKKSASKKMAHTTQKKVQANRWLTQHKKREHQRGGVQPWP